MKSILSLTVVVGAIANFTGCSSPSPEPGSPVPGVTSPGRTPADVLSRPYDLPEMNGPAKLQTDVVIADAAFIGAVTFNEEAPEAIAKFPVAVVSKTPAEIKVGSLLSVAPGPSNPSGFLRGVLEVSSVDGVTSYKLGESVPWYAMYESGEVAVTQQQIDWDKNEVSGTDTPEDLNDGFDHDVNAPDAEEDGTTALETTNRRPALVLGAGGGTGIRTLGGAAATPPKTWLTAPPDTSQWRSFKVQHATPVDGAMLTASGELRYDRPFINIKIGMSCKKGWINFPTCKVNPSVSSGIKFLSTLALSAEKGPPFGPKEPRKFLLSPRRVGGALVGPIPFNVALSVSASCKLTTPKNVTLGVKAEFWGNPDISTSRREDGGIQTVSNIGNRVTGRISIGGTFGSAPSASLSCELTPEFSLAPVGVALGSGLFVRIGPKVTATYSAGCLTEAAIDVGVVGVVGINNPYFKKEIDLSKFQYTRTFPLPGLSTRIGKSCAEEPVSCVGKPNLMDICTGPYGSMYSCINGKLQDAPRKCAAECTPATTTQPSSCKN
jgi:hypothetical protein